MNAKYYWQAYDIEPSRLLSQRQNGMEYEQRTYINASVAEVSPV